MLLVPAVVRFVHDSMQTAVPGGPELIGVWAAGIGAAVAILTQLLKKVATPIGQGPDWLKAAVAGVVSICATKIAALAHAPLPGDLHGVAAMVVNWAAGMGWHALAKALGLVKDPGSP